ncbi:phosphate ABC transporter ATPase [Candidatus Magnetobacterium bavaricum]|uniref:Phosphate ABC transporter ATPase n=1 Tax=Candidatus Magnetobacterium bavaricum TaxID=29290 RepID=A0A0F3GSH3_9BACT|nr:phosphate ABC transporter ATPase [Candidatus Magnetobacterium bavaricum]
MEGERVLDVKSLGFYYSNNVQALRNISLPIYKRSVTSLIGPSGCGKTTLLRCFNRMHDLYPGSRYEGEIYFDNTNILSNAMDLIQLRCRIGMVFQRPTPFPMTIFENVAYGLRLQGVKNKGELSQSVEMALRHAVLWDEVKDRIHNNACSLSSGQQHRLVIARSLAVRPDVLLFDEPASALDPVSTLKIEELAASLKKYYTIVIVTRNMQQAARISDWTGFMMLGELVEFASTDLMFTNPSNVLTEDYISGRF